jgi:GTP-sensing pleiotropic transcriptional regulator CodY
MYFEKKRAFATGIAVCGSGLGTFIMAPVTKGLVQNDNVFIDESGTIRRSKLDEKQKMTF